MTVNLPEHLTVNEAERSAACSACDTSVTVPGQSFGPITAETMVATFLLQHTTHNRAGVANGLTRGGRPTSAARLALLGGAS